MRKYIIIILTAILGLEIAALVRYWDEITAYAARSAGSTGNALLSAVLTLGLMFIVIRALIIG